MRLPIASPLNSRDGTANKDARLTNMLKEVDGTSEKAVIRPGLMTATTTTGNGNGLVTFNGVLVSVYGATLGKITQTGSGNYGSWTISPGVLTGQLISAAYGAGVFMGTDGTNFLISAGGISWTAVTAPAGAADYVLVSNGTSFCAINQTTGQIYITNDSGTSWSLVQTLTGTAPFTVRPFYVGGYFFLNVEDDVGLLSLWRSSTGSTWAKTSTYPNTVYSSMIAGDGNGTLVSVVGTDWSSVSTDNGDTWTKSTSTGVSGANWIAYGNGVFLAITATGASTSVTGSTFSVVYPYITNPYGLTFDGTNFILTQVTGSNYSTSQDGVAWTAYTDTSGVGDIVLPVSGNGVTVVSTITATNIASINGFSTSITTLGTVSNAHFDFAQSPL